jgi:hypothetical protein
MRALGHLATLGVIALAACGPEPASAPTPPSAAATSRVPSSAPSTSEPKTPAAASAAGTRERPTEAALFDRLRQGLVACYENGRRAVPTMTDGRLTLNVSIDASGKPLCAIPTDDTGLTQEVYDCMSARLMKETFPPGEPWTASVPVVVKGGVLEQGKRAKPSELGSVETHRMDDAFDELETLTPRLSACTHGMDASAGVDALVVAARVERDGKPQCAIAAPFTGTLPRKIVDCATSTFMAAKFPPPKGGLGLILVPITLVRQ